MNRRYIHYVTQYDSHSAGQRNTHYLCHLLNLAGYSSFLTLHQGAYLDHNRPMTNPNWKTPLLDGEVLPKDIIILNDGIGNINPFPKNRVARYFGYLPSVNAPGYWDGSKISKKELIFCQAWNRKIVEEYWGQNILDDQIFEFPSIEPDLFHPEEKTIESCYYLGKGERCNYNVENIHLPSTSFKIEQTRPFTRKGLAKILNHTKILYCFDNMTLLRQEAILSGCDVIELYDHDKQKVFHEPNTTMFLQDNIKDQQYAHQFISICNRFFGEE
jgi:hypothetical protein